jgi:hypothetical protein
MKDRLIVISFIWIFFIIPISIFSDQVKIKVEDGVEVVYNPKKPAPPPGMPQNLVLKDDLVIGYGGDSDDSVFTSIRTIRVDSDGNIYVLDDREACIKVFDKEGNLVRIFGKKGQGPCEMQRPQRMHLIADKELQIYDVSNARLSYYSLDGRCLREISTGKYFFSRTMADSKGNIVASSIVLGDRTVHELKKYDSELNPLLTITTVEEERDSSSIDPTSTLLIFRMLVNDHIVWAYSSKYELFVITPDGKTVRKVVKDYRAEKITEAEKKKMIDDIFGDKGIPSGLKLKFPKNYNPFYYFICDDKGGIYVQTYEEDKNGWRYWDVFNPEGHFVARFILPEEEYPYVVQNRKLYSYIRENEDGIPVVKRYNLIWQ